MQQVDLRKMAATKDKRARFVSIFRKIGILSLLLMQFQGILSLYLLHPTIVCEKILAYYALKKSRMQRKAKHIHMKRMLRMKRSIWVREGRTESWWVNMIEGIAPEDEWKRNFRMPRAQFVRLCDKLQLFISPETSPNHRALTVEKKVAVTLYYKQDTGSMRMTANTFGIHQCTVSKMIVQVCSAISEHLSPEYIRLPKTQDEMREKIAQFETKFGMVHAFSCVDGTHIPISRPHMDSQDYFNYKNFFP